MEENHWDNFLKTGSVEDYLNYKAVKERVASDESDYNNGTYYQGTESRRE